MKNLTALAGRVRTRPWASRNGIYVVGAEHAALQKACSDVVQHTGPVISGQLLVKNINAQSLRVTFGYSQNKAANMQLAQTLSRRNSHAQIKHEQYSGSPEHKHCLGSRKLADSPSLETMTKDANNCTPGMQKEKGRTANPTLWMNSFLNHEENQYSPVLGDDRNPDLAYENFVGQPFGSMPRFLNSERPSSLSQLLVLVFASFANSSNCALRSVGMRIGSIGERPLPFGCLSRVVDMHMPIELLFKSIGIYPNTYNPITTTPRSVCGTSEASNHKLLNEVTAMATANSNTFAHPKFTWRFLALSRNNRKAKPCRLSVEAATERDARRILAPHFILSLAARLPLRGVEMTPPSTVEEISIPPASVSKIEMEVRHA
jgi:hypothetical protein